MIDRPFARIFRLAFRERLRGKGRRGESAPSERAHGGVSISRGQNDDARREEEEEEELFRPSRGTKQDLSRASFGRDPLAAQRA